MYEIFYGKSWLKEYPVLTFSLKNLSFSIYSKAFATWVLLAIKNINFLTKILNRLNCDYQLYSLALMPIVFVKQLATRASKWLQENKLNVQNKTAFNWLIIVK